MTDAGAGDAAPERRKLILLIGAVGAGKGTQAEILSRELGLAHLASGNLFRDALRRGTALGKQAREYMDRGDLVPDDVTIAMFTDELAKPSAARGAILDGFPRTVGQARALDETLAAQGERIWRAAYIDVPTEELVARVSDRWVCPSCGTPYHLRTDPPAEPGMCDKDGTPLEQRDDDRADVVRARLDKQVPPMLEVVDHYTDAGVLTRVNGDAPIERVTADLLTVLR
ncbi:MAG TPA: nucleoside monophosphate kinase [Candidatus Limnocylindria bacterium]|nr:nucleoside monophosphate kinase [Candidatus Limnocylindria bacterium]